MSNLGRIGEDLVAQWLVQNNYSILAQRWRSSRGEIDIIALSHQALAFVEVKTRSPHNWDANGLLAITSQKQSKISQTALFFLAKHSHLSHLVCRFDIALVKVNSLSSSPTSSENALQISLGKPVLYQGYQLTLLNYIESAFEYSY